MKITHSQCRVLGVPVVEPLAGGPPGSLGPTREFVTLELGTDQGIEGIGYTSCGVGLSRALLVAVETFAANIKGMDPMRPEAVIAKLRALASGAGPGGIFTTALAAIDIALWDIRGKALNQSVWELAGGHRERVPVYASGALMRQYTLDQVVKSAGILKERGWKQMKTQLGGGGLTYAQEVDRLTRIRAAVGDDIDLMCDINQNWSVHQAIDMGRRLEHVNLYWLEDPTVHDDYAGLARINAEVPMPIAAGECVYGSVPFRHLIEARAIDFVMIDPFRAGGITPWLKIAHMAEAFNLPVVSHVAPELQVHLIAAIPNGLTVEYMPWSSELFEEVPVMDKGELAVPKTPGLGLKYDRRNLDKYSLA